MISRQASMHMLVAQALPPLIAYIGLGSASSVGCQGSALSVEREWTKALCRGSSVALARLNAGALVAST